MTSESSVLTLDHLTAPAMEHDPTSAFDPDRNYCRSERSLFDFGSYSYDTPVVIGIGGYNASRDYPEDIRSELLRTLADYQSSPTGLWNRSNAERTSRIKEAQEVLQGYVAQIEALYQSSPTDLWNHFNAELANKTKKAWEVHQGYWIRIEALRSDAMLDGFNVNGASERDFWSFFKSVPFAGKAELVLLDDGNLRAIWSGEDGSHLGLQFLGDRMLQYVIFRRRKRSSRISRVAGRDTFEGVKKQVRTFELDALLKS